MTKRLILRIFGDIQGVGFRYGARQKASELGLAGFARNELDGLVYVEAEGSHDKLEDFLRWCENEAPGTVEKIEHEFSDEVRGYDGFEVK